MVFHPLYVLNRMNCNHPNGSEIALIHRYFSGAHQRALKGWNKNYMVCLKAHKAKNQDFPNYSMHTRSDMWIFRYCCERVIEKNYHRCNILDLEIPYYPSLVFTSPTRVMHSRITRPPPFRQHTHTHKINSNPKWKEK